MTEQPYKIPFYAALLRLLHNPSELSIPDDQPFGRLVLEDFWKGFQSYLDKLSWRDTRLCVSVFRMPNDISPYNFTDPLLCTFDSGKAYLNGVNARTFAVLHSGPG